MKAHFNGSILVPVLLGYWLYRMGKRIGFKDGVIATLKLEKTTVTFGPRKTEVSAHNTEPALSTALSE